MVEPKNESSWAVFIKEHDLDQNTQDEFTEFVISNHKCTPGSLPRLSLSQLWKEFQAQRRNNTIIL